MRISLLFLSLLIFGCAKPNYVSAPSTAGVKEKAGGCQARFASRSCVSLTWEQMPTDSGFGSFVFKTFRANLADGTPVVEDPPNEVAVVLWMPDMGHGSSPVAVERVDVGTFRATKVFFPMRGNWEIRFQMKAGSDVKDQAVVAISF